MTEKKPVTTLCKLLSCENAVNLGLDTVEDFVVGLECEVESVLNHPNHPNWTVVNDGSLRNNGFEYLSSPMKRVNAIASFKELHSMLKLNEKGDPFSYRTSTHVHVNVSSMTPSAVRNMVLLYALFEPCFFMMVKPERRDNIHCVPLSETHLSRFYKGDIVQYFKVWSKYTALNLKRMGDLGTIEFRHMHGTRDAAELDQWLTTLENLYTLAKTVNINEKTLTDVFILKWFVSIFKNAPVILKIQPSLFEVIRNSLIDIKLAV